MSLLATVVGFFALTETLPSRKPARLATTDAARPLVSPTAATPHSAQRPSHGSELKPAARRLLSAAAWAGSLTYALCSLAVSIFQEAFVLWAKLPRDEGGLLWKTARIGLVQAFGGIGILIAQTLLFPIIVSRLGLKRTFQISWLVPCLSWFATPFTASIPATAAAIATLASMTFVQSVCISFAFTCTMLFISNSVPRDRLGAAHGLGQSLASVSRAVGPLSGGSLVATLAKRPPPFDEHLVFWLCSLLGVLSCALLLIMPVADREYTEPGSGGSGMRCGPDVGRERASDDCGELAAEGGDEEASLSPLVAVRIGEESSSDAK
jgi:MFS family permease